MKKYQKLTLTLAFSFVSGFMLAQFNALFNPQFAKRIFSEILFLQKFKSNGVVHFSSTEENMALDSSEECPDDETLAWLFKNVKFIDENGEFIPCGKARGSRNQLAKALYLAKKVGDSMQSPGQTQKPEFAFMNRIDRAIATALRNPLQYIINSTTSLRLDITDSVNLAENDSRGNITFYAKNMADSSVENLLTLIHEARHTSADDPAHVDCIGGDLSSRSGGCDQRLDFSDKSGAYSIEAAFAFILAQQDSLVSATKREFLYSNATYLIANRFNYVPEDMVQNWEVLCFAGRNGRMYYVDPLSGRIQNLVMKGFPHQDLVRRMDTFSGGSELWVLNKKNELWLPDKSENYSKSMANVKAFSVLPLSGANPNEIAPQSHFVDMKDQLYYYSFDGNGVMRSNCRVPSGKSVEKITTAHRKSFLLTTDGKIFSCDTKISARPDSVDFSPLQNESLNFRWQDIHGGLFSDRLFAVDNNGNVSMLDSSGKILGSLFSDERLKVSKYIQGKTLLALASKAQGVVLLESWKRDPFRAGAVRVPIGFSDFAVVQFKIGSKRFGVSDAVKKRILNFVNECQVDPENVERFVFGELLGINRQGQLVRYPSTMTSAGTATSACEILDLGVFGVTNADFVKIFPTSKPLPDFRDFATDSAIALEKKNGEKVVFYPNFFKAKN